MNPRQLRRESQHFCSLLEDGRAKYAKGRNYDAVEKLRKALAVGAKKLPRFDDNSLVKAHALLELGLACGAVCTDHATGDEWRAAKDEADRSLQGALGIFHARLAAGTLTTFRNEEMWMQGGAYKAPVPHPERLGPIDFLSCTSMALATMDPSPETIANLEKAIAFHAAFERAERRIDLEEGRQLQAQGAPPHLMNTLRTMLAQHEQGTKRVVPENWRDTHQEMRQAGTTGGAMAGDEGAPPSGRGRARAEQLRVLRRAGEAAAPVQDVLAVQVRRLLLQGAPEGALAGAQAGVRHGVEAGPRGTSRGAPDRTLHAHAWSAATVSDPRHLSAHVLRQRAGDAGVLAAEGARGGGPRELEPPGNQFDLGCPLGGNDAGGARTDAPALRARDARRRIHPRRRRGPTVEHGARVEHATRLRRFCGGRAHASRVDPAP